MKITDFLQEGLFTLLGKVQDGDVTATKSLSKPIIFDPVMSFTGDHETVEDTVAISQDLYDEMDRETRNSEVLANILKKALWNKHFSLISDAIIEKDIRLFDKMSKRRKKIYIKGLCFYEVSTGKFTSRKHKNHRGFKPRPCKIANMNMVDF